jgi:hypothetical protein
MEHLDELGAGSLWRESKLQGFEARVRGVRWPSRLHVVPLRPLTRATPQARALGLLSDPAVQKALQAVEEHTEALEALARRLRDGADDAEADAANDAGARALVACACACNLRLTLHTPCTRRRGVHGAQGVPLRV